MGSERRPSAVVESGRLCHVSVCSPCCCKGVWGVIRPAKGSPDHIRLVFVGGEEEQHIGSRRACDQRRLTRKVKISLSAGSARGDAKYRWLRDADISPYDRHTPRVCLFMLSAMAAYSPVVVNAGRGDSGGDFRRSRRADCSGRRCSCLHRALLRLVESRELREGAGQRLRSSVAWPSSVLSAWHNKTPDTTKACSRCGSRQKASAPTYPNPPHAGPCRLQNAPAWTASNVGRYTKSCDSYRAQRC